MQFFLLGLAVLVLTLLVMQGFTRANPAVVARQIRLAGGALSLAAAALFMVRGMASIAAPLSLLGAWLLGWSGKGPFPFPGRSTGSAPTSGHSSRIATDYLEMELDHDTGAMSGRIIKGMFAGRDISTLRPAEVALLWHDCRYADPQSAQVLEAYLDRIHPTWREDVARGERQMRDHEGRMQPAEAYQILGLKEGASEDEIRRAHRELMLKLHPDRGGSTYLAAKINEAKDVLLGRA